jgi:long-subunit acyl-CoA synthetase (AMP-forming)
MTSGMRALVDRLTARPDATISYQVDGVLVSRTFAELAADVDRAAEQLRSAGVRPRDHVGLCGENSYEWIVADLALIELDAVSVALSPDYVTDQTWPQLFTRYGMSLLLLGQAEYRRTTPDAPHICSLADLGTAKVTTPASRHEVPADAFTFAFSSGTTGLPKPIMMSAEGTVDAIEEYHRQLRFEHTDSIFVVLPLSAFPQRLMVYIAIACGFDMHLTVVAKMHAMLRQVRPTVVVGPPAFFEALESRYRAEIARGGTPKLGPEAFGGQVRLALTSSAPTRRETIELLGGLGFPLYEFYALTETSVITWNTPDDTRLGTVGRELRPQMVRIGDDGEIVVKIEPRRSHGYYGEAPGESTTYLADGWIATGDLGRFDEDGYLRLTGRKKSVIVTRGGYKLQPEPIEITLRGHGAVTHAVVVGGDFAPVVTAVVAVDRPVDAELEQEVQAFLDKANATLPQPARVSRLVLTDEAFTSDNGLLTRTFKPDRTAIARRFAAELMADARVD